MDIDYIDPREEIEVLEVLADDASKRGDTQEVQRLQKRIADFHDTARKLGLE